MSTTLQWMFDRFVLQLWMKQWRNLMCLFSKSDFKILGVLSFRKCGWWSCTAWQTLNTSNSTGAPCRRMQQKKNRSTVTWLSSAAHWYCVSFCVKAIWHKRCNRQSCFQSKAERGTIALSKTTEEGVETKTSWDLSVTVWGNDGDRADYQRSSQRGRSQV